MSFFKTLAAALVATATIAGTAVQAETGGRRLVETLEAAGVTTSVGACKTTGAYGWFIPAENHIHICDNVAVTSDQQWETLRHEAVHAAQRCVNPSMAFTVTSSQYLMENGSQSDWSFIQEAYDREDWAIELEAFTLMRSSNNQIADLVDRTCN